MRTNYFDSIHPDQTPEPSTITDDVLDAWEAPEDSDEEHVRRHRVIYSQP